MLDRFHAVTNNSKKDASKQSASITTAHKYLIHMWGYLYVVTSLTA